ncbi:MAG: FadR/GntR family transcriptional regulator [Bacillota bacterium]|uniref:FCD domain-containing protein n=1 Tax=Thermanaerosceptrum fracticalcis TaxID=1712410 RepID=A0A7G6E7K5_THEFR|nr:FadR/GntR family transcriptional regulator [Thermanaerosceptrum fracticalcis]QNB48059.1 FCD domain-containing protein [Thermanaerosceptrum fracticalcis]
MKSIKRTKLYEEVMLQIEEMIRANGMKEGDRLQSEKELATLFGVSRMAIREALSALQSVGLLEVRHGSGIYIRDINENLTNPITLKLLTGKENLLNILELRMGLETEAAYLSAIRSGKEDIAKMEDVLEKMSFEVESGGTAANEDFQFHHVLVQSTRNPLFIKVFETIANVFHEGLRSSHQIFRASYGPRLVVLEEHRLIYEHIKNREAEAAREAMRKHLDNVKMRGLL